MRKKILGVAIMAAIAVTAGWNTSQNENEMKLADLVLSNVKALASGENDLCPNGCTANGNGCYCNGWHPNDREARW